jgi:hypothetical protein
MPHPHVHEVPVAHLIAAVLQTDSILNQLQRELVRTVPGITCDQLRQILRDDLLRQDVVEGAKAQEAEAMIGRINKLRARGLSMTQTLKMVTGEAETTEAEDSEVYRILLEDMRDAGHGG